MAFQGTLYRFMPSELLAKICAEQSLTLVHHTLWEDPYEGFAYQAIVKPENHAEIKRLIQQISPEASPHTFSLLHDLSTTLFGQSWTKEGEELWDLYPVNNQGRSVRVQINSDRLKLIQSTHEWEQPIAVEIDYVGAPNLQEELSLSITGSQVSFGRPLLRKIKSMYEHEKEVRLMVMDWDYSLVNRRNIPGMLEKIRLMKSMVASGIMPQEAYEDNVKDEVRILEKLKTPNLRKVSIGPVCDFIETVKVHPKADSQFIENIRKLCSQHGLKFLER